jgi:DNA polymerase III delta subunit
MVVLSDITKNKLLQDELLEGLGRIPEDAELVIYEPAIDRRTALFKELKQVSDFYDFSELDDRELAKWAVDTYDKLGGKLGLGEATHLVQRVASDQWALKNELEKLINTKQPITRDVIDEFVDESFTETIFQLLDATFAGQRDKAFRILEGLRANKVDGHYVLSMIIWQVHILLLVAYAGERSAEQIAKENKLSPFVVRKSQGLMRRISKMQLKKIVDTCADIDYESKTSSGVHIDSYIDHLIDTIAN